MYNRLYTCIIDYIHVYRLYTCIMLKLGQYNKSQKLLAMGNYHQIDVCEWRLSDLLVQSASTCLSLI